MRRHDNMPFGELMDENALISRLAGCHRLIAVGDVVSLTLVRHSIVPDVAIYDGQTERREMTGFAELVEEDIKVHNPPGLITRDLLEAIETALRKEGPVYIRVEGEEDLATLACAALAPLGSCIVHGMPGEGVVLIKVDETVSVKAKEMMNQMEELI
jgi:uncharacterized protein (UPF0218 family)